MKKFKSLAFIIFVPFLIFSCRFAPKPIPTPNPSASDNPGTTKEMMLGDWSSEGLETRPDGKGGNLYLNRSFNISANRSIGDFTYYADKDSKKENLLAHFEGPFQLISPVKDVPGAVEADFIFDVLKLTPKNDDITKILNNAPKGTCGKEKWKTKVEQDVTATNGCLVMSFDLKKCGKEYEIIKVDGTKMFFGARPKDGSNLCSSEKRPTTLLQVAVVKQKSEL